MYPLQIYSKVMKGVGKLQFPAMCQGNVGDLIRAVLKSEPSERLLMKQGGTKRAMFSVYCVSIPRPPLAESYGGGLRACVCGCAVGPVLRMRSRTGVSVSVCVCV